jgi:putative membrane protein
MNIYKGAVAGAAGGLVASFVMNQFQAAWGKLMEDESRPHGAQSLQQGSPEQGIGRELEERGVDEADDNAAVRTGNAVSEFVFDHHLTKSEKEKGGAVAHYAMGVTSGAIYGAMAEVMPLATVCEGTGFGTAVWVIADEGLVPALGLSRETSEYPASVHVYSLASHLVYGLTTELVRHAVRKALNGATSH